MPTKIPTFPKVGICVHLPGSTQQISLAGIVLVSSGPVFSCRAYGPFFHLIIPQTFVGESCVQPTPEKGTGGTRCSSPSVSSRSLRGAQKVRREGGEKAGYQLFQCSRPLPKWRWDIITMV